MCIPPLAAWGSPQPPCRREPLAPVIYQQWRFAAGRGGSSFGGFISHFSIPNQLFVNVTCVLGITMFIPCDGVSCLHLQDSLQSCWDIRCPADTGPVQRGGLGLNFAKLGSVLRICWGCGAGGVQTPAAPCCPDAPGFLSLYLVRVDTQNTTILNTDGVQLC